MNDNNSDSEASNLKDVLKALYIHAKESRNAYVSEIERLRSAAIYWDDIANVLINQFPFLKESDETESDSKEEVVQK